MLRYVALKSTCLTQPNGEPFSNTSHVTSNQLAETNHNNYV
jgi:hypothetical protein